eukprot:2136192-Amphidinium_carterae.1
MLQLLQEKGRASKTYTTSFSHGPYETRQIAQPAKLPTTCRASMLEWDIPTKNDHLMHHLGVHIHHAPRM